MFKHIKKKNGANSFPSLPSSKVLAVNIAVAKKVVPSLQFSGTLSPNRGLIDKITPARLSPHKKFTSNSPGGDSIPINPVVTNPKILTIKNR